MSRELSLKTHEYKMRRGTPYLTKVNPYVRLFKDPGPEIFIQGGAFFSAGGPELKKSELPEWVAEEMAKLSPEVRAEVGLKAAA